MPCWRHETQHFFRPTATCRLDSDLAESLYGQSPTPLSTPVLSSVVSAPRSSHPCDVIRKLAVVLGVTSDQLLFGKNERGPDEELRLQFEAVSQFDAEEKQVVRSLLEGMILKHEARRWSTLTNGERK